MNMTVTGSQGPSVHSELDFCCMKPSSLPMNVHTLSLRLPKSFYSSLKHGCKLLTSDVIRRQLNKKMIENIKNTSDKISFVNYSRSAGL